MKRLLSKLNNIGDLPILFTRRFLQLIFFTAALLILYYIILDSKNCLDLSESLRIRMSIEYIACSLMLCPAFGLLMDLIIKKYK